VGEKEKRKKGGSPARAVLEVIDGGAPVGCNGEEVADGVQ
jgi:hypothetical protein